MPAEQLLAATGAFKEARMPMLLKDRVAIVTGSGRGIGRGIALALAREGARVVVNDVGCDLDGRGGAQDPARQVIDEIGALGGDAVPSYDSVASWDGAAAIVKTATDSFGRLDILVNNAGIVRDRSIGKMTEEEFDAVLSVHLKGTFNCGRHAIAVMREQGYGRIINVTSSAGLRGNFGQSNSGAAKAGIMGLTLVWAIELGRYGITVNAMAPAGMTRMVGAVAALQGRDASPEMSAELNGPMMAFLASEKAAHVSGQILGRRGYAFTLFCHPHPIAAMYKPGGWTAEEIAGQFDAAFGDHLQVPGIAALRRGDNKK